MVFESDRLISNYILSQALHFVLFYDSQYVFHVKQPNFLLQKVILFFPPIKSDHGVEHLEFSASLELRPTPRICGVQGRKINGDHR